MAETPATYRLSARPALDGFARTLGDTTLRVLPDMRIVSLAVADDRQAAFEQAVQTLYTLTPPRVGYAAVTQDQRYRLIGAAPEQYLLLATERDLFLNAATQLNHTAFLTDQSDAWVILELTGSHSRDVLSRSCMLDLHPVAFAIHQSTRTLIEQISAYLTRTGEHRYLVQIPRSSADSLAQALDNTLTFIG